MVWDKRKDALLHFLVACNVLNYKLNASFHSNESNVWNLTLGKYLKVSILHTKIGRGGKISCVTIREIDANSSLIYQPKLMNLAVTYQTCWALLCIKFVLMLQTAPLLYAIIPLVQELCPHYPVITNIDAKAFKRLMFCRTIENLVTSTKVWPMKDVLRLLCHLVDDQCGQ